MSSPVPGTLWRQLVRDQSNPDPWIIDRCVVPTGTEVAVNIYTLHHNEEYFPDPFSFKPERWLDFIDGEDEGEFRNGATHDAFVSTGSRGCAGKPMAYLESSLVIARTLWYFDFEATPGKSGKAGSGRKVDRYGRGTESEFQL